MTAVTTASVRALLAGPVPELTPARELWGFNGLHGGLTLALLASGMQQAVGEHRLASVSGQFHRALRDLFEVRAEVVRSGRTVTGASAAAVAGGVVHATAAALFAPSEGEVSPAIAPPAPAAPPPGRCEPFVIPPEFVPVAAQTQVRPVGPARPFAAGADAELVAWVRLLEDDRQPGPLQLLFLLDALAPSYAAVLSDVVAIPTLDLSVQLTHAPVAHPSPWILLRARTTSATGGWLTEDLEAWARDGTHLATGRQVRIVAAPERAS